MMSSNEELEEMIRHLQTRMVYLEGRVAQLEAGHRPYYPQYPQPLPYWSMRATNMGCSICGAGSNGEVMGYVCNHPKCPTRVTSGVGGVMSTTSTDEGWAGKRRNGYYDEDGKWVADRSR